MTTDNIRNISDYRKKDDSVCSDNDVVSGKSSPIRLSEKLRNGISPGLKTQMRQQMRKKHGL
ncbi:TPA: hypothetical protein SLP32_004532 [Enterobacter mori]|nr:hypothetical protein [Enterobacter mori]